MQFLNTSRVPEMDHPTENTLGSSTSPRKQIFQLINHRMNDPTATMVAPQLDSKSCSKILYCSTSLYRDCVTLPDSPALNLPHENSSSTASWPYVSSVGLCVTHASLFNLSVAPSCLCASLSRLYVVSLALSLPLCYVFSALCRTAPCCKLQQITGSILLAKPRSRKSN